MSIEAISSNGILAAFLGGRLIGRVRPTSVPSSAGGRDEFASVSPLSATSHDSVELSAEALAKSERTEATADSPGALDRPSEANRPGDEAHSKSGSSSTTSGASSRGPTGAADRTPEEQQELRKLKQRDAEVRRHEQTHQTAAGPHARGGAHFEYQSGPDGKRYAVGGEVSIDASEVPGDPQATITKMQQVRRAALAPAQPSAQDRAVAAQASATEREARAELTQQRGKGPTGGGRGDVGASAYGAYAQSGSRSGAVDVYA